MGMEKGIVINADLSNRHRHKTERQLVSLLRETGDLASGIKISPILTNTLTLQGTTQLIRDYAKDLPIIYDHEGKAGNTVGKTTSMLVSECKGRVDNLIIFPWYSRKSQDWWESNAKENGIGVITGAEMTLKETRLSSRLFADIFSRAVKKWGERDFVMPGTKPASVRHWLRFISSMTVCMPRFFVTGIDGPQGGKIDKIEEAIDGNAVLVYMIGTAIYDAKNMRSKMREYLRDIGSR